MNVEIAERLARRRREAGYSQESLAEKLGVSRQAVSKWERSESSPDTDNLIALAQLYGVSLDDLLYVDESLKEDVEFEAADKAFGRKAGDAAPAGGPAGDAPHGPPPDSSGQPSGHSGSAGTKDKQRVNVGLGGIHIEDGEDYVHVSWKDGVHIKDSKDGDEVHVGWDGVHVKEGKKKWHDDDWKGFFSGDYGDSVRVVTNDGFDGTLGEAQEYYHKKYGTDKTWRKFPFPLVVLIAYILIGAFTGAWAVGLFAFFLIPAYYMLGHALHTRRLAPLLEGLYPLACVAWFLWMAFVVGAPHPAWVVFLTIPVVEWAVHTVSRVWRTNRKAKAGPDIIDVEAEVKPPSS